MLEQVVELVNVAVVAELLPLSRVEQAVSEHHAECVKKPSQLAFPRIVELHARSPCAQGVGLGQFLGLFFENGACVAAHRVVGVLFQNVNLPLQLVGVGPEVVALAGGYVFSPCPPVVELHIYLHPFGVLVLRLQNRVDKAGIPCGIFLYDVLRAIGRGIVVHQDFYWESGALHHDAVEALAYEFGLVVGNQAYAE